jgi:YhcH/YjgK/YiaL family protein
VAAGDRPRRVGVARVRRLEEGIQMILDRLDTSAGYDALGPRFAAGFDYLRRTNLAAVADGKYPILGDDVFAIVQRYQTKPPSEGRWEAHRVYADIQYVVAGREGMGVAPLAGAQVETLYDADRDVEFFKPSASPGRLLTVGAGEFAVFLPHDVHMPSLAINASAEVFKVVIKVRL